MSSDWPTALLGDVTVNFDTRRKPVKESERRPGPFPYYGASGVVDYVDGFLFDGDYLLIAEDGENLRTRQTPIAFMARGKFWVNNHAHIVTGNAKASTRYLEYALLDTDISAYLTGAVMPKLTQGNLKRIEVTCPPRSIQAEIVGVLGALDDRIALLRETNASLESIAQALFKSWFVDFDPVRAKMEGRAPEGMDEATAALFPASSQDWQVRASRRAVQELIASGALLIGDGYRAKNEELGQPGLPFVRAGDLDAGQITPTKDYLAEPAVKAAATKRAKPGDTAFTSKGTIGRFAFVDDASGEAIYSPQVCFWRSLQADVIEPAYLHYWMKSAAFKAQVDVVRGQAAIMDYVSLADQRRMHLDLPPIEVQSRFSDITRVVLARISSNRATANYLTALRDTLLPRLISGQLRLPPAEAPPTFAPPARSPAPV